MVSALIDFRAISANSYVRRTSLSVDTNSPTTDKDVRRTKDVRPSVLWCGRGPRQDTSLRTLEYSGISTKSQPSFRAKLSRGFRASYHGADKIISIGGVFPMAAIFRNRAVVAEQ